MDPHRTLDHPALTCGTIPARRPLEPQTTVPVCRHRAPSARELCVRVRSDVMSREVCFTGCYEPQETLLVREILKPGMTFVDVGANWGYFTLLAAHLVGPQGTVVALEPDPRMFARLAANVSRNGYRNVTLHQFAAAAADDHLPLQAYDEAAGNFGLSRLLPGSTDAGAVSVRTRPLDSVLDDLGLGLVDLLKMDSRGGGGIGAAGTRVIS